MAVTKKTRFEVFKRDSFTCQYCGKIAPDVILEVDHINPKCKGGKDDIMNLITSCFDCNRGKGGRELSDNSTIKKQHNQLSILQQRREQLDMMIEWRSCLEDMSHDLFDIFKDELNSFYDYPFDDESENKQILRSIKKYGIETMITAIEKVCTYQEYKNGYINYRTIIKDIRKKAYYLGNPGTNNKGYVIGILTNKIYENNNYCTGHNVSKDWIIKLIDDIEKDGKDCSNIVQDAKDSINLEQFMSIYGYVFTGEKK